MGFPWPTGSGKGGESNGKGAERVRGGCKGQEGIGAEEGEDRIEREDKVKRRLSAQLIDNSTPTGINTRKPHMCVFACTHVHVPMCQS